MKCFEQKKKSCYEKDEKKLVETLTNSTRPYDKDGKTLSPFFVMNNKKLMFINQISNEKVNGLKLLKMLEKYEKMPRNTEFYKLMKNNKFNKLPIQEQLELVKADNIVHMSKFWNSWDILK